MRTRPNIPTHRTKFPKPATTGPSSLNEVGRSHSKPAHASCGEGDCSIVRELEPTTFTRVRDLPLMLGGPK